MINDKDSQSGYIKTFVVVGIVLVLVALGVLYGVRQYAASQRIAPIAAGDLTGIYHDEKDSKTSPADEAETKKSAQESEGERSSEPKDSKDAKADNLELPGSTDNDESTTTTKGEKPTATTEPQTDTEPHGKSLPETGPSDTMLNAAAIATLVVSVVAYTRSRRLL